eukprot:3228356-Lingulodinium_polyedra.AAC.1
MRFAWSTATEVIIRGGFAMLEHPAEPRWDPQAPSIWRTQDFLQVNEALDGDLLYLDQCTVGAMARKPTGL